jgi:hypothetical protein
VPIPPDLTFAVNAPNDIALGTPYETAGENTLPGQLCVEPIALTDAGSSPPTPLDGGCTEATLNSVFTLHLYTSYEDFASSQSLGFSAQIGSPTGLWSGDLFATYLSQQRSTTESIYLVVESNVQIQQPSRQFQLSDYGTCLLRADPTGVRFLQECGDRFVSSVVRGTSFKAILKSQSTTSSTLSVLSIGGRANTPTFSLSGDFQKDVSDFVSTYGLDIQVIQTGGTNVVTATSVSDLIQQAQAFACGSSTGNSYVVGVTLSSNLRASVQPPFDVAVPSPEDVSGPLQALANLYNRLWDLQDLYLWMQQQHATEWREPGCSAVAAAYQQQLATIQTDLTTVMAAFHACQSAADASSCSVPTIDLSALSALPIVQPAACLGAPCTGFTSLGGGRDPYGICVACQVASPLPAFHNGDPPASYTCQSMLPGATVAGSINSAYVLQSPSGTGCGIDVLGSGIDATMTSTPGSGETPVVTPFSHQSWSSGTNNYCASGARPGTSQPYSAVGTVTGRVGYDGTVAISLGSDPNNAACGGLCCANDTGNEWTNRECVFTQLDIQVCEGGCSPGVFDAGTD